MFILLVSKNFAHQCISYCSLTIADEPVEPGEPDEPDEPDVPDVRFVTIVKIEN